MAKEDRVELGFHRTVASTKEDLACCQCMPGYLLPSDIPRLCKLFNQNPLELAKEHLLASPGALVIYKGQVMRVPTLVPARSACGECKFLKDGLCSIHDDAPWGCAFFDYDMPDEEANKRASRGMADLMRNLSQEDSDYKLLWEILWLGGRRASGPEECREQIKKRI